MNQVISAYSVRLGNDPALVQGAGGNISWKEGKTLWIKASGTWLADAGSGSIFVPLSRDVVDGLVREGAENFESALLDRTLGRPSIETSLHALLPHRVVVHVHPVDLLARSAMVDAEHEFTRRLGAIRWAWVPYAKPGAELARAVAATCGTDAAPDALILANHGLVVGGETVEQVSALLLDICSRLQAGGRAPAAAQGIERCVANWRAHHFGQPLNPDWHALATDPTAFELACRHWVLYPDHAVFLGASAVVVSETPDTIALSRVAEITPPYILVNGCGVLEREGASRAQQAMMQCYFDVAMRIEDVSRVKSLGAEDISALLNWDAEKYRRTLSR